MTGSVLVDTDGHAGRITLNRPEALNALDQAMVHAIDDALDRFEEDDAVQTVVLDGAGDRAFCAGGDIRSIYDDARRGDPAPREFWRHEYQLNARLARYRKPIVAIMDGIVMGGGVGLSAHVRHRVVTDRSTVAMPEVGIGFAPDVGGTWLLSRAPGELGTHLALTAGRVDAAGAMAVGLADHHVPHEAVPTLLARLETDPADAAIAALATDPEPSALLAARAWIDPAYAGDDAAAIVARLEAHGGEAAQAAAEILTKSPTSVVVTLRALRQARTLPSLEACLEVEHRISSTFLEVADFIEGVRAAVVDKDRRPRWEPTSLKAVDPADIDRFFAPRAGDLTFAGHEAAR